jgi:hypothetical protein
MAVEITNGRIATSEFYEGTIRILNPLPQTHKVDQNVVPLGIQAANSNDLFPQITRKEM